MKHVLITGGAGGIGLAIARKFNADGARVLLCDVDDSALARAREEMPAIIAVRCDVSRSEDIAALFDTLTQEFGTLDVLVNNVGIGGQTLPAETLPVDQWQRVLDINLTGTFEVTQRAIPLLKQTAGTIITLSSAAGRFGYPNRIAYSVSKWGLVGFAKTLAMELGSFGITSNAILPGAVGGERFDRVIAGRAQLSGRSLAEEIEIGMTAQSIKRIVQPGHIADLALFLTTEAGRHISGQMLCIDGDMQHS
ncbi:MAG: SDR family oxidoreductase [Gammaproteobacteria bacterium]|nr:SDR family oxidoreductase [Gammaproteobacteria bacterium]